MDLIGPINKMLDELEREERGVTLSAIGKCPRELWYKHRGYERASLPPRSLRVFRFGDMIEDLVVEWLKNAGVRVLHTGEDQLTVTLDTPLGELEGHPDGVVIGDSGTPFLLEVKSCSDIGWKWSPGWSKLEEVPVDEPYYQQIQAYLWSKEIQAMGIDAAVLVIVCKNTSHMKQIIVPRDRDAYEVIMHQSMLVDKEYPPDRPYEPSLDKKNRMVLKYPCSYCGYVGTCYPEHTVYIENGKPVHVMEEV